MPLAFAVSIGLEEIGADTNDGVAREKTLSANDKRLGSILDEILSLLVCIVHRLTEYGARRHNRDVLIQPSSEFFEQGY